MLYPAELRAHLLLFIHLQHFRLKKNRVATQIAPQTLK